MSASADGSSPTKVTRVVAAIAGPDLIDSGIGTAYLREVCRFLPDNYWDRAYLAAKEEKSNPSGAIEDSVAGADITLRVTTNPASGDEEMSVEIRAAAS